ncbi:MAG: type II toxin-antitoxin system HicA family toxin [Methylovirgula sp.]
MRDKPKAGWSMSDIKKICEQIGLIYSKPTRGSHHKVSSKYFHGILTIPARRPIKVPYIKNFIGLCDCHIAKDFEGNDNGK